MAFHFLTFVALLSLVHACAGQIFAITNTETSVNSCQSIDLTWTGGTAPFSLSIVDSEPLLKVANAANDSSVAVRRKTGDVLVSFPPTNDRSQVWIVDLPQEVTQVRLQLVDGQRIIALPKLLTVNRIAGAQCSSTSSSSSISTSATSSTSSASSATSASLQSSSSSTSSSASSASITSTPPPPTNNIPTLPTEPPTSSSSTPSSSSTAGSDRAAKQNNALSIPVPAIIGISVGGALALIIIVVGLYCFRRQTRARSNPLEGWDGGYDPESVLKATARYDYNPQRKFGSEV